MEGHTSKQVERNRWSTGVRWRQFACGMLVGLYTAVASSGVAAQTQPRAYPQVLVNTAALQADRVFDPDTSNNQAQDSNTLDASADLSIRKTLLDQGPFLVGQLVRYSIEVSNAGPSAATAVRITDTPRNLEIVSVSGDCNALPCTIPALAVGEQVAMEVTTRILAVGPFSNGAAVAADISDPLPEDNEDEGGGGDAEVPAASISVAPDRVLEDSGQALVYTIEFDQAPLADTVVAVAYSGTAGPEDYAGAEPTVTIAAGMQRAAIRIVPVADTLVEPDETVIATLQPGDGYAPGAVASATGTIVNDDSALEAVDDEVETPQGTQIEVPVLDNDHSGGTPLDPAAVTLTIDTAPARGSAVVAEAGRIRYVPGGFYSGPDSFAYRVCRTGQTEGCGVATVSVTVLANRIDALDDVAESDQDGVDIDVLANDTTTGAPLDPASLSVPVAPANGEASCAGGVCRYVPQAGFEGEDRFTYQVCDLSVPERVCATASVTVTVQQRLAQLRLVKQAGQRTVTSGDLVRYTITATNVGDVDVREASLLDALPAGFGWVEGSLLVADGDDAGTVSAVQPLRVDGMDIAVGETATVTYYLRVGAGVGPGVHRNVVVARDARGRVISNEASAEVLFEGDPLFNDSLVVGTVFDDRDGNGLQSTARATGLKVRGGFAPGAYVAGSTTLDRGDGPTPVSDASAPLLHGIALGTLPGRSSPAAAAPTVEVRQVLTGPDFSGDFELVSDEGTTLRMDAAGEVSIERAGDVALGRNAQDLRVRRELGQVAGGLEVRYVVSNEGIDERGVPGVRLATVEGLLTETDAYGRYHIVGVDGGDARGRNFIVKVDPGTLPPGTEMSTPNPLVQRITPGIPVRFDFGARLPAVELRGAIDDVSVVLGEIIFDPKSIELDAGHHGVLDEVAARIEASAGGVVQIHATGEEAGLAFARAEVVQAALGQRLSPKARHALRIEVTTGELEPPALLVSGAVALGQVLFEVDSHEIRAQYLPLLDAIAERLTRIHGVTVAIVGRTDQSGPDALNHRLGLRRARAVFDALAARLPEPLRQELRVELVDDSDDAAAKGGR